MYSPSIPPSLSFINLVAPGILLDALSCSRFDPVSIKNGVRSAVSESLHIALAISMIFFFCACFAPLAVSDPSSFFVLSTPNSKNLSSYRNLSMTSFLPLNSRAKISAFVAPMMMTFLVLYIQSIA